MPIKRSKTFRDGSYHRLVWLGKRTVKDGECAAVWTASGVRNIIEGPRRVHLWFSHVRFLDRQVAGQNEYLLVQFRDGRKENFRGPLALFFDPCVHQAITVKPAFKLDANEAIVVYKEEEIPADGAQPGPVKGKALPHAAVVGLRVAGVGESGKV